MKRVFRLFPPRRQTNKERQIAECYARSPEGRIIVRLQLSSPAALLVPFEGFPADCSHTDGKTSPMLNLSKDLVDYLFARLADLEDESLLLHIHLPTATVEPPAPACSANLLQTAIQRYFAYLEGVRRQDLQKLAWDAALLGLLGAAGLGLSVLLEARNASSLEVGMGWLLLSQGVTVFGWLTLWEALANVLWHWRPLYQQLRMCQRLQLAQLELTTY